MPSDRPGEQEDFSSLLPLESAEGPKSTGKVPYVPLRDAAVPWADEKHWMEKSLILKTAVLHPDVTPEGIPFHTILNELYGDEWTSGGPNYGRAYRFIKRYTDIFETKKPSGDLLWVRPTMEAATLIQAFVGDGIGSKEGAGNEPDALPRERAAAVLKTLRTEPTDKQRALLLRFLGDHARTMQGDEGGPKMVSLPDRGPTEVGCRFTTPAKAARTRATFEVASDALTARYDVASWVTYTLPRESIDSVYDSVETVRDTLRRLHKNRFGYSRQNRPRPASIPPHLTVLEPHEDLVAHLHVVYGGKERVMDPDDLQADWADLLDAPLGKPPQVDMRTLALDDDGWTVTAVAGEGVTPYGDIRGYHRESFRNLAQLAAMSPGDLYGLADDLTNGFRQDEGRTLAGMALPFATGTRFTTASPALQTV